MHFYLWYTLTEEDKNQLEFLLNCFSEQALDYAIVIDTDRNLSIAKSERKFDASQSLIENCSNRYYNYKNIFKNELKIEMFNQIKKVIKGNGREYLVCKNFEERPKESFQTDDNLSQGEKTTFKLPDDTKEKSKSTKENIQGRLGKSHLQIKGTKSQLYYLHVLRQINHQIHFLSTASTAGLYFFVSKKEVIKRDHLAL